MIRLRNISKSYKTSDGRRKLLNNVSVEFPEGENVGILGRDSAGKSALLRLMSGIDEPDKGSIECRGKISWPLGAKTDYRRDLSGRENVTLFGQINGFKGRKLRDFIHRVEVFCELGDDYTVPLNRYTSDMFRRLDFGVSMASNFNTYLIDDAVEVGDAHFKRKCARAISEKARYCDLVIVSSNIDTLRKYCTRGAYLSSEGLEMFSDLESAVKRYQRSLH